jgi:hypothetical protein
MLSLCLQDITTSLQDIPQPARYFDAIWALPSGGLYRCQDEWYEMPTPHLGDVLGIHNKQLIQY